MFQQAFKTIIVGVDFSDYSKLVVKQAKLLSKLWKTRLVLVHAMSEPIEYAPTLYNAFPDFFDRTHYKRRLLKTYAVNENEVDIYVEREVPSALLMQVAEKYPQCLVMIGSVGMSGLTRLLFGSTAQNMALQAKFPVWIHRGQKTVKPQRIMIPHDLTVKSNRSLDLLQRLSLLQPVKAEIFHVQDQVYPVLDYKEYARMKSKLNQKTFDQMQQVLQNYRPIPVTVREGDVVEKILRRTRKFDLLVMTHYHSSGFFSKSTTATLLKKIKMPVLIVPGAAEAARELNRLP